MSGGRSRWERDHTLYSFEGCLVSADRKLREALTLIQGIEQPGDDEDILDRLGRLARLVAACEESYRTGKPIDPLWVDFES
jgi:hypothetical protein